MTARTRRIDALLREEITELVTREVHDPRIGFVTVTDVETTPDLGQARVWVTVIGSDEERTLTLQALQHAMPFVRRRLGERLRLKRIPELAVRADPTVERGTRVMHILQELEEGRAPEPPIAELPTPGPRRGASSLDANGATLPQPSSPRRTVLRRHRPHRGH